MTFLINGQIADQLPPMRRAMDYGDGLFETMRYEQGVIALWPYHLSRLMLGVEKLGIDQAEPQVELEKNYFLQQLNGLNLNQGVIKLRLVRGGEKRGYAPQAQSNGHRNIENWRIFEFSPDLPEWGKTESTIICQQRMAAQPQLAGIKHLNRLEQVLAAAELSKVEDGSVSNGLMLDQQGNLCCAVDSNLYLEMEGKILTPLLEQGGVQGVFRSYMLDQLKQMNIAVEETSLNPSLLSQCSELWLTNAVKGLRQVSAVQGQASWSEKSPLLYKIQKHLRDHLGVQES